MSSFIEQIFRVGGCYLLYLILVSQGRAVTPVIAVGGNLIGEIASSFLSLFTVSMHFQKTSDTSSRTEKPFLLLKDLFQIFRSSYSEQSPADNSWQHVK